MKKPKISVIMATYNHEPFVAEAINSVLAQEDVAFEFLIMDDGSTDNTREVVESFRDQRIKFFPNQINKGACTVTNELIERSRGEYIALINSDDVWIEKKLIHQLDILETNPHIGACFGRARFVDRDGLPIKKRSLSYGSVFDQENRSPGKWLRQFFEMGNCLCHPTMLIRRSCYEQLGLYNNRFRQLPDMDMWIRLVKRYEIHISELDSIKFRVLPGENASSQTATNSIRTINEHYIIADTFFDGVTRECLIDGFYDLLICKDVPSKKHLDIEKALLYFVYNQWLEKPYKLVGLLRLSRLLNSTAHYDVLVNSYGIDDRWFQIKMGEVDVLRPKAVAVASHSKSLIRETWRSFSARLFQN